MKKRPQFDKIVNSDKKEIEVIEDIPVNTFRVRTRKRNLSSLAWPWLYVCLKKQDSNCHRFHSARL